MYDIPKINHNESDWDNILNNLNKTRWADAENGKQECIDFYKSDRVYYNDTLPSFPQGLEFDSQWKLFYTTERGHHPRSTGGFTTTSQFSLAILQVTDNIDKIKSPILFITSDQAHSFNYTIDKYNYLTKNVSKQNVFMINVTDAEHIDFYDKIDKIPFEEIVDFLDTNLTNNK